MKNEQITQQQADAIEALAKEHLHVGLKDDLDRHKDVMESLGSLHEKMDRIIRHFNIVPVVGKEGYGL